MWKRVSIDGSDYLIKHILMETGSGTLHRIHVTDYIQLWCEDVLEANLLMRCKEMNKLVEAGNNILLGHILSLVKSETDDVDRNFKDTDGSKVFNLQTSLEGFKFRIKFLLTPVNQVEFYKEVTLPLLTLVSVLDSRQSLLVDVIKDKDVEILQYKLEGGKITRKAVETPKFDFDAFSVKNDELLCPIKSCVDSRPSQVLTPFLQELLEKISNTPVLALQKPTEEVKQNTSKKTLLKLKSPAKHKKQKMYDDDDENVMEVNEFKAEENKAKQASQPGEVHTKGKAKPKPLPNL